MSQQELPRVGEARATLGLVVVFVVVFAWTLAHAFRGGLTGSGLLASLWNLGSPEAFEATGGLVLTRVWLEGQWWRVLTAGFVHGSWLHLGLNAWALWVVGRWTERAWGPARQLMLFVLSSAAGCLASLAWAEAPVVVGASAGIFGVAAALVVARRFGRKMLQRRLEPVGSGRLAFWLVLWLVVGWQLPMLANAGHLGGAVMGVLLGFILSGHRSSVRVGAGVASGAAFVGLALVARSPDFRANFHTFSGLELLESGDTSGGYARLERALGMEPDNSELQNAVAYSLALQGVHLRRAEELSLASLIAAPGQADFLDTLGWIYCRMGRTAEGRAKLEEAKAASSTAIPEVASHLADCATVAVD